MVTLEQLQTSTAQVGESVHRTISAALHFMEEWREERHC